jgi:hypothetical protein
MKCSFHLDSMMNICKGASVTMKPAIVTASDAGVSYQWLPADRFNDAHADSQSMMPRNSG